MPLVFLDVDGVLRSDYPTQRRRTHSNGRTIWSHNPECVACLNLLTDATGAVLVVTSTWRDGGIVRMRETLQDWGVTGQVVSQTPGMRWNYHPWGGRRDYLGWSRSREIAWWLVLQRIRRGTVPPFVILDDDPLHTEGPAFAPLRHAFVQTDAAQGLTLEDVHVAVSLLTGRLCPRPAAPPASGARR